jgi:ABC-type phosphate transport system substrate-binding protein
MHRLRRLTAGIAIAATAAIATATVATTGGPALADPVNSSGKAVTPQSYDIVSVGADTDEFLFDQLSALYDASIPAKDHDAKHPYLYSWDATKPGSTSTAKTTIVSKAGCPAVTRPNGGNAGLTALDNNEADGKTGHYCIDFARTSSGRSSTAPAPGKGGVAYVALAEDAVTYATRDTGATKTVPASYAPKSLTKAQLKAIFLCTDSTWGQVGGTAGKPIKAYLPPASAATTTFWLKALGITEPGSCVNQSLEQNQGLSKQFDSPNAIFIYSVGDWIAQKYHSAAPGKKPTAAQNKYGSDQIGYLGLNKIDGVSPITTAKTPTINKAFKATGFTRTLYDIVRWASTTDHIPAYLEPILSRTGYFCHNANATKAIKDYGFLPAATCGSAS